MKKKYGVVLIGCGHIGRQHLQEIYYREAIRLVGVVDIDARRAEEFFLLYHADSWSTDYHGYLERPDVDIVIIATYVHTHLPILRDCLLHKKHVLCEKPIAATLREGEEFTRLVKSSDCKVLIAHILRHNQTYRKAAQLIREGAIGEPTLIRMVQNHHCKDWERYKKLLTDCSPIVDCGVHYIDVMRWFTGFTVTQVSGFGTRMDDDLPENVYNYGIIHVRLKNGCIGYYEAGWSKNLASCNLKEFIGRKGRIRIVLNANRCRDIEEGDLIELYDGETNEYQTINLLSKYKDMWAQLRKLIEMIETDTPAVPTMDEVLEAFQVVMQADAQIRKTGLFSAPESEMLSQ